MAVLLPKRTPQREHTPDLSGRHPQPPESASHHIAMTIASCANTRISWVLAAMSMRHVGDDALAVTGGPAQTEIVALLEP